MNSTKPVIGRIEQKHLRERFHEPRPVPARAIRPATILRARTRARSRFLHVP